ncbi:MAG: hypothetical protein RL346_549 [Verrucomicrobiota bacterium]|jgi:hypothetical protein
MRILLFVSFCIVLAVEALAHGRSAEMIRMLNAPVPDWMSLAEPVKVEPTTEQSLPAAQSFRPRSGGATNSRNRVQIPERGIEFQVDYSIVWTGNNAEGLGVSLSPDGTKLIVSSGTGPHLYEIDSNGQHKEIPIRLPEVTYDDGPKGFISKWAWAGDDVLIGKSGITDERGHELLEVRFYLFHLKEQALARLDLSALKISDDIAGLEIAGIGNDLEHLKIRLGDREFAVKADLKSPPRLLAKPDSAPTPNTQSIGQPPAPKKAQESQPTRATRSEEPTSSTSWSIIVVLIVAAVGLLWLLVKNRK